MGFKAYSLMTYEEITAERETLRDAIRDSQAVIDSLWIDRDTQFQRWLASRRDESIPHRLIASPYGVEREPIPWRLIACTDGVHRDECVARAFERDLIDRAYMRLNYFYDASQRGADRAWKAANGRMRELPSRTYRPDLLNDGII